MLARPSQQAIVRVEQQGVDGLTSAVVEGLNNAIRGVICCAYGYHVFEHFRLHVMVEHGNLPHPLPLI